MSQARGGPENPDGQGEHAASAGLDGRRRALEAAIAEKQAAGHREEKASDTGAAAGFGAAMKLSSEFIAGIVVGAALGWFIDRLAGTSPWGLIVFLLLGFCAGVLNVLRSAGKVAYRNIPEAGGPGEDRD